MTSLERDNLAVFYYFTFPHTKAASSTMKNDLKREVASLQRGQLSSISLYQYIYKRLTFGRTVLIRGELLI
jgi:hypothetical protein